MPAYTPITASLHDFGGQGLMGARLIIEPKGWDTPDADGTAQIYLPDVRTVVFVDDTPQTFQLEDCAVRRKEVGFNVTARFFDLSKGVERSVSLGLIVPQGAEEVALRTLLGAEDHPPSTQIDALAAALAAKASAQAAAAQTAIDRAAAELAAIEAALYDGPKVDTQPELAAVTDTMLPVGKVIRVIKNKHVYEHVADAAPEFDVDHTGTGGLKYLAMPGERGYSLAQFEAPLAALSVTDGTPSATGGDASDAIDALFSRAIKEASGGAYLGAGIYRAAGTVTLPNAAGGTVAKDRVGFRISGAGRANLWPFGEGGHTPAGTVLMFDAGKQLDLANGRSATMIEDITIVGASNGDALINDAAPQYNGAATNGGGFKNVLVIDHHTSEPAAGSCAVELSAVYGCAFEDTIWLGRADLRAAYDDPAINIEDLFVSVGWRINCQGQGAQGRIVGNTVSGYKTGILVDAGAGAGRLDNLVFDMQQFSFCGVGLDIRKGVGITKLVNPHFEYNTDCDLWLHEGAGALEMHGGSGGQAVRNTSGLPEADPGNAAHNRYMARGGIVLGDADLAKHSYGPVYITRRNFSYTTKATFFLYGGPGDIVIDKCFARGNGGLFVALDITTYTARGQCPDVLIRDFQGPLSGGNRIPNSYFFRLVTPVGNEGQHSFDGVDRTYLIRIENCGKDGSATPISYGKSSPLYGDLNLATRKYPPKVCHTLLADTRNVTLGDAVPIGMDMTLWKRFASSVLNIIVPAGTTVIADGVTYTGATAFALATSTTGIFRCSRVTDGLWVIQGA